VRDVPHGHWEGRLHRVPVWALVGATVRAILLLCFVLFLTVTLGKCASKGGGGWKPEPLKRPDALRAGV
jgi:hypothetical protein